MDKSVRVTLLFIGHACCSIFLVLINKTISVNFPFPWTVVLLQNSGTIICSAALHALGRVSISPLRSHQVAPVLLDSVWLIAVLWSSFRALQEVSVPLYVVVRNMVPFCTALCERIALKRPLDFWLFVSLLVAFSGTMLYSAGDFSTPLSGTMYAVSNVVLVATLCVYERYLMTVAKNVQMTAVNLNFYRVLLAMPLNIALAISEGCPGTIGKLAAQRWEAGMVAASAFAAFGIGTLLFSLQGEVSATTIQVTNVAYKCLTTFVSRFTHPSEVGFLGYVGYALCTAGVLMYSVTRSLSTQTKQKDS